jgi:hypothetical protein
LRAAALAGRQAKLVEASSAVIDRDARHRSRPSR